MSTTFTCTTLLCPWPTHCSANHLTVLPQPPPAPPLLYISSRVPLQQIGLKPLSQNKCTRSCKRNIHISLHFGIVSLFIPKTLALLFKNVAWDPYVCPVSKPTVQVSRKMREMNNVNRFGDKGCQRSSVTTPMSNTAQPQPLDRFKLMSQVSVLLSLGNPLK